MSHCGFAYALGVVGADCPLLAACSCQALAGSLEVMTLCLKGGHVPPQTLPVHSPTNPTSMSSDPVSVCPPASGVPPSQWHVP